MLPSWIKSRNCRPRFGVLLGDRHDQAEVGFDQLLLRLFRLRFAARDRLERAHQLLGLFLELRGHRVDLDLQLLLLLAEVLALLVLQLRAPVLHRQLPFEIGNLPLQPHHRFDLVLDLIDHPALDRLGEFDLADQPRHLDEGAHAFPADLAILALVLGRRALAGVLELLLALLGRDPRLADRLDLAEDLFLAVLDLLVGQLLVDEGDQLADAALVILESVPHLHDDARDRRRARDRLDDGELAALDPLGDLDFALTREERHRAHLAQVHADRIVGLVERTGRQIQFELLGPFTGAVEQFLFPVGLLGVDDFDAGAPERAE